MIQEKSGCGYPIKHLCLMMPDSGNKVSKKAFLFFSDIKKAVSPLSFQTVFSFFSAVFRFSLASVFAFPSTFSIYYFVIKLKFSGSGGFGKTIYNMTANVQERICGNINLSLQISNINQ